MMNEAYVKRTIASLDNLVDAKLMQAKKQEFKQRIKEALSGRPRLSIQPTSEPLHKEQPADFAYTVNYAESLK